MNTTEGTAGPRLRLRSNERLVSCLDCRHCLVFGGFFVKLDSYVSLLPQVETQIHVFEFAKSSGSPVRVPEIVHFFHRDGRMAYAVMEYIELTPTPVSELAPKAALAVQWLRDVPALPDKVNIGPLGGGLARHKLFKNYKAPLTLSSVLALERYLNAVRPHGARISSSTVAFHSRMPRARLSRRSGASPHLP